MLSYMLLLLLHCAPPNILPKGIRAVTKLLESEEASRTTDKIIAAVMQKLNPMIKHMSRMADLAEAAVSNTRLYRTREEIRDEVQQGVEATKEEIQKITESFHNDISKLTEMAAGPTNGNTSEATHHQEGGPSCATYAEALNNQLPASHLSTLARSRIKERQVLIDTDPSIEPNSIGDLTE